MKNDEGYACADCVHCDKRPDGQFENPYDYPRGWRCKGWKDRLTGENRNPACSYVRPDGPCHFFERSS